jgi:hypothetical protein
MPISLPQEASQAAHRLPPANDPRVHPAYPGRPRGRAGHCPTTSRRRRPGPNRRLGWPSACASFEHEAPTQADHEPVMDAAGDHADPGHPSHTAACPTAALQDLTSAGQRTRQRTDTGQRTPDSGHLDAQTPAPDTGRGRGQGDEGAAGIRTSWATTPSDRTLGRPTVFLWTAPAALDSPCRLGGEAAFQREIASRRQLLGRSARVERRLGALLSCVGFGWYEERAMGLRKVRCAGAGLVRECWWVLK